MEIYVTSGTGEGPTPIAAFDAALIASGIANYNLIFLSSVIPPGSVIRRRKFRTPEDEYGHKLYVVVSRQDEQQPGRTAWAGLGWTQEQGGGRGLFVELHGGQRDRVEDDIRATLTAMVGSRTISYGEFESEIVGIECRKNPVCAVAIAVYQSSGWNP